MVKTHETSLSVRVAMKTLKDEGYSSRAIAEKLNISYSTVNYSLRRFNMSDSHENMPRSGRPKATTTKIDREIVVLMEKSNECNAVDIAERLAELNAVYISPKTVRRRLHEAGLHGRSILKKPLLTKRHIKARYKFGLQHQSWTVTDWKRVLFSDETKMNRRGSDGKVWTWRRPSEPLKAKHVKQTIKHDDSVMLWGCFNSTGVGELHVIEGIMNSNIYIRILSDHMIPFSRRLFQNDFIFQQDNDPKHKAKKVLAYLASRDIVLLDWPSQSPDLNPIENLWHKLKTLVNAEKINKKADLVGGIKRCWESIGGDYCRSLVESMPRRMDELVRNKGQWTHY